MRLLSLDYEFVYGDAEYDEFASDHSLMDFDVVIWDPVGSMHTYIGDYRAEQYRGRPSLSEHKSARLISDVVRRRADMKQFLENGRTLVVIGRTPGVVYVDTGERQHSGTGRNRATTHIVTELDIVSALPADVSLRPQQGANIELCGGDQFAGFWADNRDILRYEAVLGDKPSTAIFTIQGTQLRVGAIDRFKGGGVLLVIPAPAIPWSRPTTDDPDDDGHDHERGQAFQSSLLEVVSAISASGSSEPMPAWADKLLIPGEDELRTKVRKQEQSVERARQRLAKANRSLTDTQQAKLLITASGRELELAVRDALAALGGKVTEPPPGRDDWLVDFNGTSVVVEVKGKSGSAAERDAAQLEKWVSRVVEDTGAVPKAILVVNAFRKLPVAKRTEAAFPDQMLGYASGRKQCLVTGLQLLLMRLMVERGTTSADEAVSALLEAEGRLPGFTDWQEFLTPVDTAEE